MYVKNKIYTLSSSKCYSLTISRNGAANDPDDTKLDLDLNASGDTRSLSKMGKIESARASWRKKEQSKLEQSWMSLDLFDRSQRGRLSLDFQGKFIEQ